MRRVLVSLLVLAGLAGPLSAQDLTLPNKVGSVKFAVIGDSGTGDKHQLDVAKELELYRAKFPFTFVIMLGDNLYGGNSPKAYEEEFSTPYKPLLAGGVKFYASLGNHDDPSQRFFEPFNMGGQRYYTFKPANSSVRFFALDSNYMDAKQLAWLDTQLKDSGSDWKIGFFHHPPYSSGEAHGSDTLLRSQIEPVFLKYGVNAVFNGHEHFYERIKPQKGIAYFIAGSSAKIRVGNIATASPLQDKGFDTGYTFMLVEVSGDDMFFQAITATGLTIDSGNVHRIGKVEPTATLTAQPVVATPVAATPQVPTPVVPKPVVTKPAVPKPVVTKPVVTKPAAAKPAAATPATPASKAPVK